AQSVAELSRPALSACSSPCGPRFLPKRELQISAGNPVRFKRREMESREKVIERKTKSRSDWVRWSKVLAVASLFTATGLAATRFRRPRDIRWLDHAHVLHHAMSSNFRVVDGVRIHYQEKGGPGDAETIILLHGFCSSNYTWKDCIEPLADAGFR